jgi:hypothetical protein
MFPARAGDINVAVEERVRRDISSHPRTSETSNEGSAESRKAQKRRLSECTRDAAAMAGGMRYSPSVFR